MKKRASSRAARHTDAQAIAQASQELKDLFGPLHEFWARENRIARAQQAKARAMQKARDKRRKSRQRCTCPAYPWPHRPGGGLCRWPDPPVERWQGKAGKRPWRKRYAGIRRQIARANGLHPIRDRLAIDALVSKARVLAKKAKREHAKLKRFRYREVELTPNGIRLHLPGSHPEWRAER